MAENEVKLVIKALDETKAAFTSINSNLEKLKGAATSIKAAFAGMLSYLAVGTLTKGIKELIDITDQYKTTIAETAALWTTFTKIPAGTSPGEVYKQWRDYAEEVYQKLTEIDAQILGTRQQAIQMVGVFAQHGQVIDINNKAQLEGFRNIMNAVQIITQGQNQEIQLRQEINALLSGTANQNARLMQLLMNIDPQLKEHLKTWQEEGTVIENIGKMLAGFDAAASDLENIFQAQKTTLQSIVSDILREGFAPVMQGIGDSAKGLISYFQTQREHLTQIVRMVAEKLKAAWDFIVETVKLMLPALRDIWDMLKTAILPVLVTIGTVFTSLVGTVIPTLIALLGNVWRLLKASALAALSLGAALTGQFGLAKQFWEGAKGAISGMTDVIGVYQKGVKNTIDLYNKLGQATPKETSKKGGKPSFELQKDKEKGKAVDIDRLRGEYAELMLALRAELEENMKRELMEVDKWELDRLNKVKEYRKKGVITEEEYQSSLSEIEEAAAKKRLDIYEKYAQEEADIENEIAERTLDELEKRLWDVEDWYEKVKEKAEKYVQDEAERERIITEAKRAAEEERFRIKQEYEAKLQDLRIRQQEAEVETLYKAGAINEEERLRRIIELNQQLLSLLQQRALLAAQAGKEEAFIQLSIQISQVQQKIIESQEQLREKIGTLWEGFLEGFKRAAEHIPTAFQSARDAVVNIVSGMTSAFTEFFDVTSQGFMNLQQLAFNVLQTIYKELLKVLVIQPLMRTITGGLGSIFGGLFHEGGLVVAHEGGYIPRFHLGTDEVPAILQTGERVLSRKQNQIFEDLAELVSNAKQPQREEKQVTIVNVLDPHLVGEYLSTSQGQQMIVNAISRQSGKVKKVLWG